MLHAVVGLTTVEECRAREYPNGATLKALPKMSKKSTSTLQRSTPYNTRQWFDWFSQYECERSVIGDIRLMKFIVPPLEYGAGMPYSKHGKEQE